MTKPMIALPRSLFLAKSAENLSAAPSADVLAVRFSMLEASRQALSDATAGRLFVILPNGEPESLPARLHLAIAGNAAGIILPAPCRRCDVQRADVLLGVAEAEAGGAVGRTAIIALSADSAASTGFLMDAAGTSARLLAIGGSGLRLAESLGLAPRAAPVVAARGLVTLAAAAARIGALADLEDGLSQDAFEAACRRDRGDGFTAKFVTSEDQAAIANTVFNRS